MTLTASRILEAASSHPDPIVQSQLRSIAARQSLREAITACTRCPLHLSSIQRVPWTGGPSNVAIVGEAPGADEDRLGSPFVGRAGDVLTKALQLAGLTRDQVGLMNTICCRPPKNDYSLAREVDAPESCSPWFTAQLDAIGAWLIITMGNSALSKFRSGGVGQVRGKHYWENGRLLAPTYHPAYVFRDPTVFDLIVNDLVLVRQILDGRLEVPVPKSYDPTPEFTWLRGPGTLTAEIGKFVKFYKRRRWAALSSPTLDGSMVLVQSLDVIPDPAFAVFPRYTVAEVIKLRRFTAEGVRAVHRVKAMLGGEVQS